MIATGGGIGYPVLTIGTSVFVDSNSIFKNDLAVAFGNCFFFLMVSMLGGLRVVSNCVIID